MNIITSKTDEALANQFNRRNFLRLAFTGSAGIIIHSQYSTAAYAFNTPTIKIPAGFTDFLKKFGGFALDLGMSALGYKMSEWLPRYPAVQQGFNSFLRGVNGYNPWNDFGMIGGLRTSFLPIQNPNNGLFMMPFFNQSSGNLGSGIDWYSAVSLPQLNEELENTDSLSANGRAQYLIPRKPKKNNWADRLTPERYDTDAGSTEFKYKGDQKSGEVDFKIWTKATSGTLQEPTKTGTFGVEVES